MAGFGHVAAGMVAARLHGEAIFRGAVARALLLPLLAMLPDFDVFPLVLGVPDRGLFGHRGLSHSLVFALLVATVVCLVCRRHPRRWTTSALTFCLVASHGVLDALAQDGRGIMFFWPLTSRRFHFPFRPIPDAPLGLAFFTRVGMQHLLIELVYFLPFTLFALWPRRRLRRAGRQAAPVRRAIGSRAPAAGDSARHPAPGASAPCRRVVARVATPDA